jgi:hypothetical protein
MAFPQKISPVMLIACPVIIVGIFFLVILSPIPFMYIYNFLHQHNPDAICLYPPVEEKTVSSVWGIIVNRTGIDSASAAFESIQVKLAPDESIESIGLSFYATRNGEGRRYSVYLRYDPDNCGTMEIHSYPSDPPEFANRNIRSPREILDELPKVKPSVFGISNQSMFIATEVSRETNATYYSMLCTDLFLLKNGTVIPVDQMVLHDTQYEVNHWNIFPQRCSDLPGFEGSCHSDRSILVFSYKRLPSADFVLNKTGNNQPVTLHECPHGPVQGQSCKTILWSTSCVNWTEY